MAEPIIFRNVSDELKEVSTANPLPVAATFNATPTTRTEGQGGPLQADELGNVKATLRSYDSATSANKVFLIRDVSDQYVSETLIDTTNVGANTNYYPSASGVSMDGYSQISIQGMTSGGVTTTIEATNDDAASPDWVDVTAAFTNIIVNPPAIGATYVDVNFALVPSLMQSGNFKAFRIKSVTSDNTNVVQYNIRRIY